MARALLVGAAGENRLTRKVNRLLYLDLMRGLAAVIMLQGHVFHSLLRNDLRNGGPYVFSQFLGGMPPAVFLFLTGITLSFLMDSNEKKGLTAFQRWVGALGRSRYLFVVAILFRIQLWMFSRFLSPGANSPWTEMLKVDILNCMGFGIAVLSVMAVFRTTERVKLCAVLGVAIALLSPLVTQAGAHWPWLIQAYIAPSFNYFAFFPWAAFVAFGLSFGSLLRILRPEQVTQTMQWAALTGIALAFGANSLSGFEPKLYRNADFWLDGPTLIFIKLGALLIAVAFCYVWMMQPAAQGWSWVRQLGTTSLLVYWVHIELVYGHWLGWMKTNLNVVQTATVAAAIIALMVGLSYARTSWPQWKQAIEDFMPGPQPSRVSGD